jgi:hypothetical protein
MDEELRIAIRFTTVGVPGLPAHRPTTVANDFATWKLSRSFSEDRDFVHLSTDFDSDVPKRVWILCDFNIRELRSEVHNIPIEFWKVKYNGESA